jgi:hypothetical protein
VQHIVNASESIHFQRLQGSHRGAEVIRDYPWDHDCNQTARISLVCELFGNCRAFTTISYLYL